MSGPSQKRATKNYRKRLSQRGMTRFEVLARRTDQELIRSVARALTEDDAKAKDVRDALQRIAGKPTSKGGILAALRRSPMVGAELELHRPVVAGREVEL